MLRLEFPDPADSPTGSSPIRIRYRIEREAGRARPVLTYQHGARVLTAEAFAGFAAAGARIIATTDRDRQVAREALGEGSGERIELQAGAGDE